MMSIMSPPFNRPVLAKKRFLAVVVVFRLVLEVSSRTVPKGLRGIFGAMVQPVKALDASLMSSSE